MSPDRGQLSSALRDTTVALSTETSVGTGFFVAPNLVLTCAHVVGNASAATPASGRRVVQGAWRGQVLQLEVVPEWLLPKSNGGPDLALLRVLGEITYPVACVAESAEPGDELWAYGYPDGTYRAGDSLAFTFEGPSRGIDGTELYRAAHGRAVGGFSGSPVLNWRTGMVCGIIRLADNPPGGPPLIRLTPMSVAADSYPGVLRRQRSLQHAWLDLLDDDQLRFAGSSYPGPRLRGYLRAVCHVDEERHAAGDNPDAPRLLEVYQSPQFLGLDEGPVDVSDTGIGDRDLLVVGDPGAGKSSLLRWLRHRAAQRLLAGEEVGYVPVLLPARVLAEKRPASFPEAIAEAVNEELGIWLDQPLVARTFTREPVVGTPWLMLVDGFEEILTPEFRKRAIDALAFWAGRAHLRLLMTSRPLAKQEFEPLDRKGIFRAFLAPFDADRIRRLASTWLHRLTAGDAEGDTAQRVERLIGAIERGQIRELARIPLITTMLCILDVADGAGVLPRSRYDLYEQFVNACLERQLAELDALPRLRELAQRYPGGQQAAEQLLAEIHPLLTAYAVERAGAPGLTGRLSEFVPTWTEEFRPKSFPVARWIAIVMEVLRQSGLVIGDDISHQTIADFLVARQATSSPRPSVVTPKQAAEIFYLISHRSLVSFVAAGWARRDPDRFHSLCENLAQRTVNHQEFLVTLLDDGVEVPPDIVQRVAQTLATAANNPVWQPEARVISAAVLARLDRERALPRLRVLALDPRTDESFRTFVLNDHLREVDPTRILMDIDPESAHAVLRAQIDDSARPAERRLEAARRLTELDSELGAAALQRLIQAPSTPGNVRFSGLTELAKVSRPQALETSRSLALETGAALQVTLAVSEFDPGAALDDLARFAVDPALVPRDRVTVALRWALLRPGNDHPGIILASLAMDPSLPDADRLDAISALSQIDPARTLPLLQDLAGDPATEVSARARAAELLGRLHPQLAAPVLSGLGNLSGIDPALAVDLFAVWMETSVEECTAALVSYIRAIASRPFTLDELSLRQEYLPKLIMCLRQADHGRCATELDVLIHDPHFGVLRDEAEKIWAEVDPERCADHLAAIAGGSHEARAGMEEIWKSSRGEALLVLAQMGDGRAPVIAKEIVDASRLDVDVDTHLLRYAAMAISKFDKDRGADLLAEVAQDKQFDPLLRQEFLLELYWVSEARLIDTLSALNQDREMRKLWASFYMVSVDEVQSRDILTDMIRDTSLSREARAVTVKRLLHADPVRAVDSLMQLASASEHEESTWARRVLAEALGALEVATFAEES
jgi:Trypsin-like peptidase domain/NACHT domain